MEKTARTGNHLSANDLRKTLDRIRSSPSAEKMAELSSFGGHVTFDSGDISTPEGIARRFAHVYDKEWQSAYTSLKNIWNRDEIIYRLMRIVRVGNEFCQEVAQRQLTNLRYHMERIMFDPSGNNIKLNAVQNEPSLKQGVEHVIRYRCLNAATSIPAVQEKFIKERIPGIFDVQHYNDDVSIFVQVTIALVWLMSVQDPAMTIFWLPKGDNLKSDYFHVKSKGGKTVDWTLWPAVTSHDGGHIFAKGTVVTVT
ncbi:hypothetical protein CHS0354_026387 [Potamilus streckersoni]|uniref:Mitochondria-eating protein C-terminal domain-containing protein n=1 Tax=Potamilus streckersoni TaxID=2493646 RepID=A0AAE0W5I2_9BIVA|nr:hypothetical protein CHS0354_026387 [Potamilus streckersoni]